MINSKEKSTNAQSDKIKGTYNFSIGKVKQAVGKAINDEGLESRGLDQKVKCLINPNPSIPLRISD